MGLVFLPTYIKYLGIEAYGLIGIFAALQGWLTLLDMGMTPVLGREMARFTDGQRSAQSIRDLLRTIETIAMVIAFLTAIGIWLASGWLASDWLKAEKLPLSLVAQTFSVMGVVTALRFIENIYRSAIIGLQRQVLLSLISSAMATLRGFGAVGVMIWVAPTVEAFFVWQGLISIVTLALFAMVLYKTLPHLPTTTHFSLVELKSVWRFAAGISGSTFLVLLLTQIDKILLSRILTLEHFGYYSLAIALTGAFCFFTGPIGQAYYPRFAELSSGRDESALITAFHSSMQLIVILMGTASMVLIFFSETVLFCWTHNSLLAHEIAPLVTVLALGTLLNGLTWIPYQMQIAHGWTSLTIRVNAVAVIILVPAIFVVAPRYGAMGVAWIWVALNIGY
ncbi:MAG TPA: polysaccharide biosynthesis protein, partial [Clostridiales bacterium]|nr:polysaccharide biosynthesis protein [Clostridiales bacterium]